MSSFGHRLRRAREAAGLTRPELARAAGISSKSVQNYETDDSIPSVVVAFDMAGALDTDIYQLLTGTPGPGGTGFPGDTAHAGGVGTSEAEREGFLIVRGILRETVDPARVAHRGTKSYFGILLDNNNRRPICHLHFNSPASRYLELFDGEGSERVPISDLAELYQHAERLKAAAAKYDAA